MKPYEICEKEIEHRIIIKENIFRCLECDEYETSSTYNICAHLEEHYVFQNCSLPDGRRILFFKDKGAVKKWCMLKFGKNYGKTLVLMVVPEEDKGHEIGLYDAIEC